MPHLFQAASPCCPRAACPASWPLHNHADLLPLEGLREEEAGGREPMPAVSRHQRPGRRRHRMRSQGVGAQKHTRMHTHTCTHFLVRSPCQTPQEQHARTTTPKMQGRRRTLASHEYATMSPLPGSRMNLFWPSLAPGWLRTKASSTCGSRPRGHPRQGGVGGVVVRVGRKGRCGGGAGRGRGEATKEGAELQHGRRESVCAACERSLR